MMTEPQAVIDARKAWTDHNVTGPQKTMEAAQKISADEAAQRQSDLEEAAARAVDQQKRISAQLLQRPGDCIMINSWLQRNRSHPHNTKDLSFAESCAAIKFGAAIRARRPLWAKDAFIYFVSDPIGLDAHPSTLTGVWMIHRSDDGHDMAFSPDGTAVLDEKTGMFCEIPREDLGANDWVVE